MIVTWPGVSRISIGKVALHHPGHAFGMHAMPVDGGGSPFLVSSALRAWRRAIRRDTAASAAARDRLRRLDRRLRLDARSEAFATHRIRFPRSVDSAHDGDACVEHRLAVGRREHRNDASVEALHRNLTESWPARRRRRSVNFLPSASVICLSSAAGLSVRSGDTITVIGHPA